MTEEVATEPEFKVDFKFIQPFLNGLKPIRRITVSEWCEAYRVLGRSVSNISGPWRNSVTPYLPAIMDSLSVFATYQEVVFMKGTQIAATSGGENATGYWMHITPAPILIMYPTVNVAKRNSKRRLKPLIEDSPVLRKIVSPAKSRDGNNTILEKEFPGGNLLLCGANSPSDLRSVNIRFCIFDEIDEYPGDLADQGDPIEIAKKRTSSYDTNKKILYISTPTTKGNSHIETLFLETDQHYLYVPCPHCAPDAPVTPKGFKNQFAAAPAPGYQKLVLEQFRFTEGNPDAVFYECLHCKKEIHNHHKSFMLPRGVWIPDKPELSNEKRIGFHLSAFYSPIGFYSWQSMAYDYEQAKKDPIKMKTFVQTTEGMPFEEEGAQPPYRTLFERYMESYQQGTIPDEVCFLTAGIDVQRDRVEIEIVGWGKGQRSYSIDYMQLLGRPEESAVWLEVQKVLNNRWVRKTDGMIFGLSMTFIDAGYSTNEVFAFCLRMGMNKILPCRGLDTQKTPISSPKAVYLKRDGKKAEELMHITINTDYYKSSIYAFLTLQRDDVLGPEKYCHFPREYQLEHYRRLTAEKKITAPGVRGYDKPIWKKEYPRNEQLDCRVYAMAAATLLGIDAFQDKDYDKLVGAAMPEKQQEVQENKPINRLPGMGNLPKL